MIELLDGPTFDIGVDVDDVLFPWSQRAHAACVSAGITNGKQITQWGMHLDYGCTSEELWEVLHAAYRSGMLLGPPVDGVVEELLTLQAYGHRVHVVTARGFEGPLARKVREDTRLWLDEYGIPHDSLTFAKDKTTVECDYFVDDSIPNVTALRAAGVEAYLHDQPHNLSDTRLPRVTSLAAFVDVVLIEVGVMCK